MYITWRSYACTKMEILIKEGNYNTIRKATEESEHTWLPFFLACSCSKALRAHPLLVSFSLFILIVFSICIYIYASACMATWIMRNVYKYIWIYKSILTFCLLVKVYRSISFFEKTDQIFFLYLSFYASHTYITHYTIQKCCN